MLGPTADVLSLLYAAVALYTLWQLPGRWRALFDADYTADDRNLANRMGFLLLTPLGVLAHELAHYGAAYLFGAQRLSLSFRVYWGFVSYQQGRLGPLDDWLVAVAGPAASLLLGLLALVAALRARQARRDVLLGLAHATLLLVLVFYPLMSAIERAGDFVTIYGRAPNGLHWVAGAVHALGLAAYAYAVKFLGREARQEAHAEWDARFADRVVVLCPEALTRLASLEQEGRFRRLTPDERQELAQLGELRAWSAEHNRGVSSARAEADPPRANGAPSRPDAARGSIDAAPVVSDAAPVRPDVGSDR